MVEGYSNPMATTYFAHWPREQHCLRPAEAGSVPGVDRVSPSGLVARQPIVKLISIIGYNDPTVFNHALRLADGASPRYARKNPEAIQELAKVAHGANAEVVE